ncbi:protein containing RNA polymerase sigma factor 70, region 4 type 2 domain protein, partial [human gut metagenome]
TAKLLAEALHSLPDDKREAVLLYYFFEMNDAEIAKLRDVPRSTIQYRRTSSFELLKRYLEEKAPMTAQLGNTEQDERGLLPYPVIIAATKGDPEAMNIVVQHYESYIASLSMRKLRDERGNIYWGIDEDIRDRLRSRLMRAVLSFKV